MILFEPHLSFCLMPPIVLSAILLIAPAAIAAHLSTAEKAIAQQAETPATQLEPAAPQPGAIDIQVTPAPEAPLQVAQTITFADASEDSLPQILQDNSGSQDQVTSVSQLSDVRPTDWAFQALQSLVERYGCIVGYPDRTYQGGQTLTRYEFAAGLNACLDRVNELIASELANAVTQEDLAAIQRLQAEFATELATLRGRVDALEARTTELEASQFSTTTVLYGNAIFSLADEFGGNGYIDQRNSNTVFQSRVQLDLSTSFTGQDRLLAELEWGNFRGFGNSAQSLSNPTVNDSLFSSQNDLSDDSDTEGNFQISQLEYYFPVGNATIYLEATGASISDIVSSVSALDDEEQGTLSYFGYNPIYDINPDEGSGVGLTYDVGNFQIGGGYLTGAGSDPSSGAGLLNGDYALFGQLTYGAEDSPLIAALTYVNSYRNPLIINAYGAEVELQLSDRLFISGWAGYFDADDLNGEGDSKVWTYAGTLGFADLGIEGSLLGFIVGVPPRISEFSTGGDRIGLATQDAALHLEGFYRLPINDNITITPGVIWVMSPGNNNSNDDFVTGVIRTSFSF